MRGVTVESRDQVRRCEISTRTPHAGSDRRANIGNAHVGHISTRTPHAGSDPYFLHKAA